MGAGEGWHAPGSAIAVADLGGANGAMPPPPACKG